MKIKKLLNETRDLVTKIWKWLKPYLVKLHVWRKRVWHNYQINKILILLALTTTLITGIYLYTLAKSANVKSLKAGLEQSTVIYDQVGTEAGKLFGQKGTFVALDQISPYVQDALISTEDRNFYTHNGYDIKGIGRAVVGRLSMGTIVGGGSTITQQLAKNAYLTQDQTLSRKARELFLAIEIEEHYSKDQILEMYLNNSYFGNGVWGIEDASRKYFGVSASELTAGEAATLVGILKGPGIYNPIDEPENATNRRDTILQLMVDNGKLSQAQADEEARVPITSLLNDTYSDQNSDYRYPYYFDAVINEAVYEYDLDEDELLNHGYKIYTNLNQTYQQAMQDVYQSDYLFPENASDGALVQSGSVALNPKTGGVQALVGGRGEHVYRGFNRATQIERSPGSSLKPIAVYTPALEAGYKPDSILQDTPQDYYDVENYSRTYSGEIPMYQALAESLNAPAVWLLHEIGLEKGYEKTKKFGIPLTEQDSYYGLALGGLEKGTSPLVMANAYSPFATGGTQAKTHLITKIVDSTGAIVVDNTKIKTKQLITKTVSEEMTSMLLGVFSSGTGINADPNGFVMAGKTGTTETEFDPNKTNDQWVVGYTPDIVLSTWLGFDETDELHYLEGTSATYASTIFRAQAEAILPNLTPAQYPVQDAYLTGGQVLSPNETQTNDTLDDLSGKIKEGAKGIGGKLQDGWNSTKDGVKRFFNGILGQ